MPGTLESLAAEVGAAFSSFEDMFTAEHLPRLFVELGLDPSVSVVTDVPFLQVIADAAARAGALPSAVDTLVEAAESNDDAATIQAAAVVIDNIGQLAADLDAVATDLARIGPNGSNPAAISAFAVTFAERVLQDGLLRYLARRHAVVLQVLQLAGIAVITPIAMPPPAYDPAAEYFVAAPAYVKRDLHLERLGLLFNDSLAYLQTTYGWGTETFDASTLFARLAAMFDTSGRIATVDDGLDDDGAPDDESAPDPPVALPALLEIFALAFLPTTNAHPPGIDGRLYVDVPEALDLTLATFGTAWRIALQMASAAGAALGIRILPPANVTVAADARVDGEVSLALLGEAADTTTPFVIFGETGGSRFEATSVRAGVQTDLVWDAAENQAASDIGFSGKLVGGRGVVDTSKSDAFLRSLLPADGLTFNCDLDLSWSAQRGFHFTGGAGLETAFALNLVVGPFHIQTLHVELDADPTALHLETSLDGSATLGPITASAERIGVALDLAFSRGNLGPVDLRVAFKPPTGLGVNISAGPVSGGGYLGFDPTNGRYTGVMALSVYGVQVSAIGLLDTKLPNGETGYSFLVLISVEFTPIQLGFGFTLNGVGGLCGIHRDFVADAIRAGLRTHSLDAILFPPDPIANAPQIISELRSIFPPTPGRYVFGPMAKIGWGGGINLVTAELGVLFSLPSPLVIAVLGQLNVTLPNPDAAIVALHLDVLGVIDFGKKLFSLDGTLHDSRVASFPLMGDMAMRLDWGSDPSFALSIGGLNPHFQPPDGFPQLKPITISLSSTNALSLTIQSYLGVTSNTFQFGAQCELRAGAGSLDVYGWLCFDALFVFSPFSFDVDFSAGLALRSGTSTLMGISVRGELSGPTPWHVTGDASISLLFFSISVHIDITWGSSQQISAPVVDAWPPLKTAVATPQNWSGSLPAGIPTPVTLSTPAADPMTIYVDPNGVLTLRERVLPLNQAITKFGESVPGPQTTFTVVTVELGGVSVPFTLVTDKFAPAQFEEMSDQEKLSRPSFDDGIAGFSVGAGQLAFGQQLGQDLVYVDLYDDDLHTPAPHKVHYNPTLTEQLVWAKSSNAFRAVPALAPLAKFAPPAMTPPLVTFGPEQFVVATTADLAARTDITAPVSKGEAYRALAAHLAANPSDTDQLQVVPLHELAA